MATISFEPVDAPLGALLHGLDPLVTPDSADTAAIAAGLAAHSVLVIRGHEVSPPGLVELGRALGQLELFPEADMHNPDHPEIVEITNVRPDGQLVHFDEAQAVWLRGMQRWHGDGSCLSIPPRYTLQYSVEVTARGGQTQFADMRKALRLLPPEDRVDAEKLRLVHSYTFARANAPGRMNPMSDAELDLVPAVEHPWVRTNPDGTKSLYMGAYASHIVGRDPAESRQWFAEIEAQLSVHDVVYEHQWQPHDLLIWDSRTTMHRALGYDMSNERRVMRRVAVAGDPASS